jgi:hypothetical protein
MFARTLVNVVNRMVYPFLPDLSRIFGVSPELFAGAMSIRSVAGLANIVLSTQTDRRGR